MSDYYNKHAQDFFDRTVSVDMAALYKPFLKWVPAGGHILDAGCGSGRDSLVFLKSGYQVTAFDASPEIAKMATQYTGQSILQKRFKDIEWKNEFDGIWACASLLHIKKDQLFPTTAVSNHSTCVFQKLVDALKPGGVFYFSFKKGNGERTDDKGRLFLDLNCESLTQALKQFPEIQLTSIWRSESILEGKKTCWTNGIVLKK